MTVYICRGSKCKKHKSESKALRNTLDDATVIEKVKCQKICKGMVAGVEVEGSLEWFRKLENKKDFVELRRVASSGRTSKTLAAKRVKKRAGKLR